MPVPREHPFPHPARPPSKLRHLLLLVPCFHHICSLMSVSNGRLVACRSNLDREKRPGQSRPSPSLPVRKGEELTPYAWTTATFLCSLIATLGVYCACLDPPIVISSRSSRAPPSLPGLKPTLCPTISTGRERKEERSVSVLSMISQIGIRQALH